MLTDGRVETNWDVVSLLSLSQRELDELYRKSKVEAIPVGSTAGLTLLFPGTRFGRLIGWFVRGCIWQGKVFEPERGQLVNLVSPFRLRLVRANVYVGESWLDGQPAIIIDYSKTSLVARFIRDELREVAPGLFLGIAYVFRRKAMTFILHLPA